MGRPILYPEAEALIKLKKSLKAPSIPTPSRSSTTANNKHKRRQSFQEKNEKKIAKHTLLAEERVSNGAVCSSCGGTDHKRATSKACPNYQPDINELIKANLGKSSERFVVSLPLRSFSKEAYTESLKQGIKTICGFQREVMLKAMLFVNNHILKVDRIYRDLFKQNYWYSICRVICGQEHIDAIANEWCDTPALKETYTDFILTHPTFLMSRPPTNYAKSLSYACLTTSTCYLNFYVELFESRLFRFCIDLLKSHFPVCFFLLYKY